MEVPTNDQIKTMIDRLESPMLKVQREVAGTGYLLGEAIHVHCDTDRLAASAMLRELLAEREILDEQSHVNVLKPAHIRRRKFGY